MRKLKVVLLLSALACIGASVGIHIYIRSRLPAYIDAVESITRAASIEECNVRENCELINRAEGITCLVTPHAVKTDKKQHTNSYYHMCTDSYAIFYLIQGKEYDIKDDTDLVRTRRCMSYNKYIVKLYDVNTGEYRKDIDIKKILKEYPDYYGDSHIQLILKDNKEQLLIRMYPQAPEAYIIGNYIDSTIVGGFDVSKSLVIDPDSLVHKVEAVDRSIKSYQTDQLLYDLIDKMEAEWVKKHDLQSSGNQSEEDFKYVEIYNGYSRKLSIYLPTDKLSDGDEKLFKLFPKLRQYKGKAGYDILFILSPDKAKGLVLE